MYSYYMTQRPPCPGAQPRKGLENIRELDPDAVIPAIGKGAYAIIEYSRPLTEEEIRSYELTPTDCVEPVKYRGYRIVWSEQDHGYQVLDKRGDIVAVVDTVQEAQEGIDTIKGDCT